MPEQMPPWEGSQRQLETARPSLALHGCGEDVWDLGGLSASSPLQVLGKWALRVLLAQPQWAWVGPQAGRPQASERAGQSASHPLGPWPGLLMPSKRTFSSQPWYPLRRR